MPMIGLGTWQLRVMIAQVVLTGLELGYRHIDTDVYKNHKDIGMHCAKLIFRGRTLLRQR